MLLPRLLPSNYRLLLCTSLHTFCTYTPQKLCQTQSLGNLIVMSPSRAGFVKICFYHDKSTKLGNLIVFVTCTKNLLLIDIHKVSSVSARKLKCPSSARLGSELSQLGLARAGKFQLELISTI